MPQQSKYYSQILIGVGSTALGRLGLGWLALHLHRYLKFNGINGKLAM